MWVRQEGRARAPNRDAIMAASANVSAEIYSDLSNDPLTSTAKVINASSVYQALSNLFNTGNKQRLFRPDINIDLRDELFEIIDKDGASKLYARIVGWLQQWEPRVKLDNEKSTVTPYMDQKLYYLELYFTIDGLGNYEFKGDLSQSSVTT